MRDGKMLEIKRPTTSKISNNSSSGFYVRMKLFNSSKHGGGGGRYYQEKKSSFTKYFKWLLWVSLCLYFFTSYLITNKPSPTSLPHTTIPFLSTKHFSRALIESHNLSSSSSPVLSRASQGLNDMKVYVYDLPPKFNKDWLANKRCSSHLFASEVAIHKALLKSDFRTFDPWQADFFFVPVYVSCNFSTANGFPAIGHARPLLASAIQFISSQLPFWNRSHGADHVFVASHDYGSCFHAMEEAAKADGVPEFLKKSIILQTFGVNYFHPCQDVENVLIPPYVPPKKVESTLLSHPLKGKRDIWVFFRGKMEVHPKNISGKYYSKKVRTVIWEKFNNDRRFYLKRHRFAGYLSEIARSVFCLCPLGWAPWSPRLVESVALGCVPVVIADGIRLPFSSAVNWSNISLTVAERDVGKLGKILEHVARTNLSDIQRNLWDPEVRRALLFHDDEVPVGDATWQVLRALSSKVPARSYRKSRVSSE